MLFSIAFEPKGRNDHKIKKNIYLYKILQLQWIPATSTVCSFSSNEFEKRVLHIDFKINDDKHGDVKRWRLNLLLSRRQKANRVHCPFKSARRLLRATLPLLVIFCIKMAAAPESRVLTFSVFKWSSYSSTYLPEWVMHTINGVVHEAGCVVLGGLLMHK